MSKALEAATRAVAKAHGCGLAVCWSEFERGEVCRCKADASAAILAFLRGASEEADSLGEAFREGMFSAMNDVATSNMEGPVKSANDAMGRGGARSMLAALSRLAGETTP